MMRSLLEAPLGQARQIVHKFARNLAPFVRRTDDGEANLLRVGLM